MTTDGTVFFKDEVLSLALRTNEEVTSKDEGFVVREGGETDKGDATGRGTDAVRIGTIVLYGGGGIREVAEGQACCAC